MGVDSTQHCEQTLMFTDIVGYSRLMGRNESLAVEMLGDYRKILLSHIEAQGGQLVEFVGDAIFARFDTATAAVSAAIAIQQHLLAFNEARDKKLPRLQTRIGLNKGEVMLREGAVFGDAVNIAARLEPLAVADGICISQSVYDEVRFSLSSPAKRLGVQPLKNIQQKIRVYFIKPAGIGWRDHLHYFLRGLNRKIVACRYPIAISVLALIAAGFYFIPRWLVPGYAANYVEIADFKNLMNEKGDADYFSAGITEAVRSQLADMRDVYIVDAKEGIHAPIRLEGSVQKLGDNLRIAYRLFRRKDNVQIAGGKLDGTYQDIFILQDRLVGEIARYLADEFDLQNFRPAPLRLTNDITAYDFYLKGLDYLDNQTSHENADQAIANFQTALIHDEKFYLANAGLCEAYWKKYEIANASYWLNEAEKNCLKAIEIDFRASKAYKALGGIYRDTGRFDEAIKFLSTAVEINADDVNAQVALALTVSMTGEEARADAIYQSLIKKHSKSWRVYSGYAYYLTRVGEHHKAIENNLKVLDFLPDNLVALNNVAVNYYYLNEFSASAKYFSRAAEIEPSATVFINTGTVFYVNKDFESAINYYRKAIRLEPENYQYFAYLGDALKFIPSRKKEAVDCFLDVIKYANAELEVHGGIEKAYQYLARANVFLGDIKKAKHYMEIADKFGGENTEAFYSHLRIAIQEHDEERMIHYANRLLSSEYTLGLLLTDPDFLVLNDEKIKRHLISK